MNAPPQGPLTPRQGPYIRNAQAIGAGMFLVEAQRGTQGKGKVWTPTVVMPNDRYKPGSTDWNKRYEWRELGYTKPGIGYRGKGSFKVCMWFWIDPTRRYIEAFFETELMAVQFMVRNAPEFVKP